MTRETHRPDNCLQISARIIERSLLRYSPSGVPVSECVLEHRSLQQEAGQERQIEMQLAAIGLGPAALALDQALLGQTQRLTGFLAQTRRNSRNVVFHITAITLEFED